MNIRTLVSPNKALALTAQVFAVIFCILMTLSFLSEILPTLIIKMSFLDLVFTGLFFAFLSVAAYYIRAARKPGHPPQRPMRGAERIPMLPYREENE